MIVFLSDCDPDGDMIAESFARSLRDDFSIKPPQQIIPVRAALTPDQVNELLLPPGGKAKKGSANYGRFVKAHGSDDVYELEAVPPKVLQQMLMNSLEGVIDIAMFNAEVDTEATDAKFIDDTRRMAIKAVEAVIGRESP